MHRYGDEFIEGGRGSNGEFCARVWGEPLGGPRGDKACRSRASSTVLCRGRCCRLNSSGDQREGERERAEREK